MKKLKSIKTIHDNNGHAPKSCTHKVLRNQNI